jgi:hypothetical protein
MRCVDEGACYRALAVWGQYSAISRWANVSANTVSLWCAARLPAGAGRGGRGVGSIDHTRVFDCRRMRIAHAAGHGFGHFHVCPVVPDTTQPPRPHRSRSRAPRHGRVLLTTSAWRSQRSTGWDEASSARELSGSCFAGGIERFIALLVSSTQPVSAGDAVRRDGARAGTRRSARSCDGRTAAAASPMEQRRVVSEDLVAVGRECERGAAAQARPPDAEARPRDARQRRLAIRALPPTAGSLEALTAGGACFGGRGGARSCRAPGCRRRGPRMRCSAAACVGRGSGAVRALRSCSHADGLASTLLMGVSFASTAATCVNRSGGRGSYLTELRRWRIIALLLGGTNWRAGCPSDEL